jgi:hypothetical protein
LGPLGIGYPHQGTNIFHLTFMKEVLFYDTTSSDPIIIVVGKVFLPFIFIAPYKFCCRARRCPRRKGTPPRQIACTTSGRTDRISEGIVFSIMGLHRIGIFLQRYFLPQQLYDRYQFKGRVGIQLDQRSKS